MSVVFEEDDDLILLRQIRDQLKVIAERLGGNAASSVEVKSSTRGVDVTTKAYVGSPIEAAGNAALAEYFRLFDQVEAELLARRTRP